MSYIERYIQLDLPTPYSCFLWGARKTGKSTFLKHHFPHSLYYDFLKADVFRTYLHAPETLRQELMVMNEDQKRYPIILDEVQKVPLILDEVHWMIENLPGVQFILCGSSARKLKLVGANLLGGRAWRYMFLPLCYPELKTLNWQKIFNNGLLPSHYTSAYPEKLLASYLYDYLIAEVQLEANLRKQDSFTRFLEILGFCHGEMVSFSNVARDCGVNGKTVKTYFDILVDMYLGYFLHPFRKKASRQIIQETPKFYLFDTGIANYLKRYQYREMRGIEAGKAFEHYIFLELTAYHLMKEKREKIYYWRTKEGTEVDFVLNNGEIAIETTISTPIERRDLKGLLLFDKEYKAKLHVVTLEPRKRLMQVDGQEVTIWPVEEFLNSLWAGNIV
jgi:predicted AAA+ superfamily ATPase